MRASDQFGDRLRQAIHSAGQTQRIAAQRLGVSESVVSNWTRARNEPSLDDLSRIAQRLNVSVDWLLGLTERKALDPCATPEPASLALTPRARKEADQIAARAEAEISRLRKKLAR